MDSQHVTEHNSHILEKLYLLSPWKPTKWSHRDGQKTLSWIGRNKNLDLLLTSGQENSEFHTIQ